MMQHPYHALCSSTTKVPPAACVILYDVANSPFMLYGREAQQLLDKASYHDTAATSGASSHNSAMAAAGAEGAGVGALPAQETAAGGDVSALSGRLFKWARLWQLSTWPTEQREWACSLAAQHSRLQPACALCDHASGRHQTG
jgi:hypothetical protein